MSRLDHLKVNEFDYVIPSPVGLLGLQIGEEAIQRLLYLEKSLPKRMPRTGLAKETVLQLNAYFKSPNFQFELPLAAPGPPFQKRVWNALCSIDSGMTVTYGELAKQLDTGARAVGNACRNNPIVLIVPCHRVVRADGLGGYAGRMGRNEIVDRKRWLLKHENSLRMDW